MKRKEYSLSSRHVLSWAVAAPIIGFVMLGCGNSSTTFTGLGGGGGNGGTSPTGSAGSEQGGSGGSSDGNGGSSSGGSGNGGTSSNGGSSNGGSGGTTGDLGYEPVGVGDPWFFNSASELDAFEVELTGATGAASWNSAGEVRLPLTFTAAADKAFFHFTAPFDATTSTHDPMNLTHRVLKARVRIASGATATGGVEPYSQSTSGWTWKSGTWNSFADLGAWRDVEYDFDNATDPTSVLRFGLQVYATSAGAAELIIDDIRLEPKPTEPGPDGGVIDPEPDAGPGEEPGEGDAGVADGGGDPGPVGIGDPWYFDAAPEMTAFEFAPDGIQSWSDGAVHMNVTCAAAAETAQMHFTTPYDGSVNVADMSDRTIKARVRVAAGATADAGVQVFAQSGGWQWSTGDWNGIAGLGSFTDVTFPLSGTADDSSVQRFGLQVYCTSAGSLELIVDDLRIEPTN